MPHNEHDLDALAAVLVECMDGRPHGPCDRAAEKVARIRVQRDENQVFGVKDAERWSSCKQLIDFVDELIDRKKPALQKLDRPVSGSDIQRSIVGRTANSCSTSSLRVRQHHQVSCCRS